jgi:uncharacterized protein (DUF849 family)
VLVSGAGGSAGTLITLALPSSRAVDRVVPVARDCAALGVAVVRLDVPAGPAPAAVAELVAAVREAADLVVELSTGRSGTDARPGVLDAGPDVVAVPVDADADAGAALHTELRHRGIAVRHEVSDLAQLAALDRLLDRCGPPSGGRVHVDLVLGRPGGLPGTLAALAACLPALPTGATFTATGVGPSALPVLLAALSAGGHLQVGTADPPAPGEPGPDDVRLVARAAGLARLAQRPPLSTAAARRLLGVPGAGPAPAPEPTRPSRVPVEAAP